MLRHAFDNSSRIFYLKGTLHLADLVAEHPLNFVAHGFPAGGTKMDLYPVSGFADFLHKRGAFVFLLWHRNLAVRSADVNFIFFAHITPFVSKSSIHRIKGLQRIMAFYLCPFGQIMWAAHHNRPETLLTAVDTFPAKRIVCHSVSVIQEKLPFQLAFLAHSRNKSISFHRCGWIDGYSVVSRCCFQGKPAL